MPRVTYLLPTNKINKYLWETLRSIDNDEYKDKSVVIIDNTLNNELNSDLIEKLKINTPIKIVHCPLQGVAQALNVGIQLIDSEYTARIDGDDLIEPNRTETQVLILDNFKKLSGIGSAATTIDHNGHILGKLVMPKIDTIEVMKCTLEIENSYIHPSIMLRTKLLKEKKYSEWATNCQDWDLWIRMALDNQLIDNTKQKLIKYRLHNDQVSKIDYINKNRDALKKTLQQLKPNEEINYFFQRVYLENKKPSYKEIVKILINQAPNIKSIFAARKLMSSLIRCINQK